jgi:hypothetical protein
MKLDYQFSYSKKKDLVLLFSEFPFFIYYLIFYVPIVKKFRYNLKKIFEKKKKVLVLGNGPSLKKDLNKINANNQLFVLNNFPSQKIFFKLKPRFICWIDTMYLANKKELSDQIKLSISKTFYNLNRANWKIFFFVTKKIKKEIKLKLTNKNITFVTIPNINFDFESSIYLHILSFFKIPPPNINVAITAIYISILSGVHKVDLIGADMNLVHSIQVNQKHNQSFSFYAHFYRNKKVKFSDKLKKRKPKSIYVNLIKQASGFKWFAYMAMIASNLHILLKNKSSYSLIDSIDR